jgi:hypothetical protein
MMGLWIVLAGQITVRPASLRPRFSFAVSPTRTLVEGETRIGSPTIRRIQMGRKTRTEGERRNKRIRRQSHFPETIHQETEALERELKRLSDGEFELLASPDCPPQLRKSYLEDVLAFESIHSGPSLFQGLQRKGLELPRPETLSERESADKVVEILEALAEIQVFVTGFEHMTPQEAYARFWNETLWEGCYAEKQTPGAITVMDASHQLSRTEVIDFMKDLQRACRIH